MLKFLFTLKFGPQSSILKQQEPHSTFYDTEEVVGKETGVQQLLGLVQRLLESRGGGLRKDKRWGLT